MSQYYARTSAVHLDGTPIFKTKEDRDNEATVAQLIEAAWGCKLGEFGALSPIDWYAQRDGRLVGLLELKTRWHPRDDYPGVFLNARKWLALSLGSIGMGVPALFVVKFTDGVYWVPISKVDATTHRIGGCSVRVKSVNDIEPIIEVPLSTMVELRGPK
jgi:hypothetical protein